MSEDKSNTYLLKEGGWVNIKPYEIRNVVPDFEGGTIEVILKEKFGGESYKVINYMDDIIEVQLELFKEKELRQVRDARVEHLEKDRSMKEQSKIEQGIEKKID